VSATAFLGALALGYGSEEGEASMPSPANAEEALNRLAEGNARFAADKATRPNQSPERRSEVAAGQDPWAVVWGCIDSRVPPELIFDQGLGDLFVIRTAGQALDSVSLASVEFGVEEFHVPLVVVLGHDRCGAVSATVETLQGAGTPPGNTNPVVEAIGPAYESVKLQPGDPIDNTVRANVRLTVDEIKRSSLISHAVAAGAVRIVGARYDLDSGAVDFGIA
jgi:carbonic anhydrase